MKRALQTIAPPAEQPDRDGDVGHQAGQDGRWLAGAGLPARVTVADLQRGLGISRATYYRLKQAGRLAFLELTPTLDPLHPVYSGYLLARWLRGDLHQQGPVPRSFFGVHAGQNARGRRRRATQEEREA